ncbi:hypothetical protein RvY_18090-2 [Ramazzottius varieornatus]|uniref:MARVEL domain-containing protein n=1 Tax=Ramazzottius varieornatus TaxID=947166 RepID=A0A1D1W9W1_RAMVA|nr:hypothetical protein RvY_18090-2 [Ramazzottius varieornatus]
MMMSDGTYPSSNGTSGPGTTVNVIRSTSGIPPAITPQPKAPSFFISLPGILTTLALICSIIALISVEAGKRNWGGITTEWLAFHELTTITSFFMFSLLLMLIILQNRRFITVPTRTMKFILTAMAAFWALLLLISASVMLDNCRDADGDNIFSLNGLTSPNYGAWKASGVKI